MKPSLTLLRLSKSKNVIKVPSTSSDCCARPTSLLLFLLNGLSKYHQIQAVGPFTSENSSTVWHQNKTTEKIANQKQSSQLQTPDIRVQQN